MKREFLEAIEVNGVKLSKDVVDSIMAENGKDIEAGKTALATKTQELTTITTERDGLKTQIADRDKDIKALQAQAGNSDDLNTKLAELQAKYDTDTATLHKQLADQSLNHATEKFFGQFEFASELAKKAAIAEFKEQGFKFDDKTGDFQGGKDWIETLKKSDPAAFKTEPPKPTTPPAPTEPPKPTFPHFVNPVKPNPKKVGLAELMKLKNENPNAAINYDE